MRFYLYFYFYFSLLFSFDRNEHCCVYLKLEIAFLFFLARFLGWKIRKAFFLSFHIISISKLNRETKALGLTIEWFFPDMFIDWQMITIMILPSNYTSWSKPSVNFNLKPRCCLLNREKLFSLRCVCVRFLPFESEYMNMVHKCTRVPLLVSMKGKRNCCNSNRKKENYVCAITCGLHAHLIFTRCSHISHSGGSRTTVNKINRKIKHVQSEVIRSIEQSNANTTTRPLFSTETNKECTVDRICYGWSSRLIHFHRVPTYETVLLFQHAHQQTIFQLNRIIYNPIEWYSDLLFFSPFLLQEWHKKIINNAHECL